MTTHSNRPRYQCCACSAVEYGDPRKICPHCDMEFTQLRNLIRELSRRLNFSYGSLSDAFRTGINKLIDLANNAKNNRS